MMLPKDPGPLLGDRRSSHALASQRRGASRLWTIVNVEEWAIERNMPRTVLPPPYGQPLTARPAELGVARIWVCGWASGVSGNAKSFDLKATLAINGSVCKSYPRVAEAGLKAGWEFMGHGYIQRPCTTSRINEKPFRIP
jgi:hypothetical protein